MDDQLCVLKMDVLLTFNQRTRQRPFILVTLYHMVQCAKVRREIVLLMQAYLTFVP